MGTLPQLSILKGSTRPLSPNAPIQELFERVVAPNANKAALIIDETPKHRVLTYNDLNELSNKIAKILTKTIRESNAKPNSDLDYIIGINMHPSEHLIVLILAIWKAGAAYLPLDHSFPQPRIDHIVKEAQPVLIVYDEASKSYGNTKTFSLDKLLNLADNETGVNLFNKEELAKQNVDIAIVMYTSGSTGVPKGVRIPHKAILNRIQWQYRAFPFSSTEKLCVFKTALTFVDSVAEIWAPLLSGLTLLVIPKKLTKDPQLLIELLERHRIERLTLVPSLLRSLLMYLELKKEARFLSNLKLWVCSGETLSTTLVDNFFKYFPTDNDIKLCNFYGSTEIMADVTYYILTAPFAIKGESSIPIGVPIDNTMIYLLDEELRPVPAGEIGELFISGKNLSAGYSNGRDKSKFMKNEIAMDPIYSRLFRTGDFGRLSNSIIYYNGRTDSQVKIRGHRVDLSEIERAISEINEVEKAVVLCYMPGELNQALLAFVKSSARINEYQIEEILKGKLTGYMVPQVVLVESIPLLVNGKIDRQKLLKSYESTNNNENDTSYQIDVDYTGVPSDKMIAAQTLFTTIASVLNKSARSAISIKSNFFAIGGNSLNSIYTITKINEAGYFLDISDFLSAEDLGVVLHHMTTSVEESSLDETRYRIELFKDEHKATVIEIISTSFHEKAELERCLKGYIQLGDYAEIINLWWNEAVKCGCSFVAINVKTNQIIGVSLNMDLKVDMSIPFVVTSNLSIIFDFIEYVEEKALPYMPEIGEIFHSNMLGTHSSLSPKENVALIKYMEDELFRLAKQRKFKAIFATNTNPLTQQLATVHNYKVLIDYQINEYFDKKLNRKPFGHAADSDRAIVGWKLLE